MDRNKNFEQAKIIPKKGGLMLPSQIIKFKKKVPLVVECPRKYGQTQDLKKCLRCEYFLGEKDTDVICTFVDKKPKISHENTLNELAGNEWLFFTKTVLRTSYRHEYGHDLRKTHYANKPPQLMKHIIEFFTKQNQTVLDPFAGVGGTLIGASLCDRKAVGIELNERWVDIYKVVCREENINSQKMIVGDCLEILPKMIEEGKVFDHITTDPPYSIALEKTMCTEKYQNWQQRRTNFESFSDDPRDLRNLKSFEKYYDAIQKVGVLLYKLVKKGGYLSVILRDSYQNGEYVMASYETAKRIIGGGFKLKGIKIWYGTGARVRPYGYPHAYVPNIVHQNLLILRKE